MDQTHDSPPGVNRGSAALIDAGHRVTSNCDFRNRFDDKSSAEECSETQASDGSHTLVMEKNPSQWGATSCGLDKVQQERMRCGVEA